MNRNIPLKTFFTTSTDITKSYFGISAGRQVQEQQMQMQQLNTLSQYKNELLDIITKYITRQETREVTIQVLGELYTSIPTTTA